jgi:hypothetical protein
MKSDYPMSGQENRCGCGGRRSHRRTRIVESGSLVILIKRGRSAWRIDQFGVLMIALDERWSRGQRTEGC